jgi:hypothetical protein
MFNHRRAIVKLVEGKYIYSILFYSILLTRTWSLRLQAGNLGHNLRQRVPGVRQ